MFYVYVLKSNKDGNFYIGHTEDIKRRLGQHNDGLVKSTKLRRPFDIVFTEEFNTRSEARWREKRFKTAAGRAKLKALFK